MIARAFIALSLAERSRRIATLAGFALLFLASGVAARALTGEEGHAELGRLFELGGYPAISAMLLLGWLLSRFPMIATLVLLAGLFSDDRAAGRARLYAVRPVSLPGLYTARLLALLFVAFALNAVLLPLFDLIMLGKWAGPATLVVILCYVTVYGGVMALLSVFTRAEGWIALALGIAAMIWDALRRGNLLVEAPPGVREAVSFILPPQGPLFRIETAFAETQPLPWVDVAYVCGYGLVLMLAAAVMVSERDL